jgi:hypothetical protein
MRRWLRRKGGKFFGPSTVLTQTVTSHFTFHLSLSLNVTDSGTSMRRRLRRKRGKFFGPSTILTRTVTKLLHLPSFSLLCLPSGGPTVLEAVMRRRIRRKEGKFFGPSAVSVNETEAQKEGR